MKRIVFVIGGLNVKQEQLIKWLEIIDCIIGCEKKGNNTDDSSHNPN